MYTVITLQPPLKQVAKATCHDDLTMLVTEV